MIKKSSPTKAKQNPKPSRLRLTKETMKDLEPKKSSEAKGGKGTAFCQTRVCGPGAGG